MTEEKTLSPEALEVIDTYADLVFECENIRAENIELGSKIDLMREEFLKELGPKAREGFEMFSDLFSERESLKRKNETLKIEIELVRLRIKDLDQKVRPEPPDFKALV